ncbi:MAG: Zn-dependent alcohol dehydrogenase [Chloroflexi bacterium]|nr:Zn-dependent alcohol dehydrogenase [Chloroflexota bacterium]
MRAAVLHEQGKPIVAEEVELEDPKAGEVRVRMTASGVCHSCLHAADGSWPGVPVPMALGDEGAGTVTAVGAGVTNLRVGDPVVLSWAPSCRQCRYCVSGRPVLCERRPPRGCLYDGTTRMRLRGQTVYQYGTVASFSSETVVPESCAVPITPAMPLDRAALIGCSVMTGVGAVINTAQVPAGASMAVWGAGGIGLNVVQGGVLANAHPIIAVDVMATKLAYAEGMGASHVIDASREDPVAAIQRLTGRGADYTFVAVGHTAAVEQAWAATAPGGACTVIGLPPAGSVIQIPPGTLVGSERRLIGSSYGSARTFIDFPRLVELYLAGKLRIDELISRRYEIGQVNEAFRAMVAGEVARGLIVF